MRRRAVRLRTWNSMKQFTCPRCTGTTFGTSLSENLEVLTFNCTSDRTGTPMSMTHEEFLALLAGGKYPNRDKACGWRGKEFPGENAGCGN